jgi:hypothetical protein
MRATQLIYTGNGTLCFLTQHTAHTKLVWLDQMGQQLYRGTVLLTTRTTQVYPLLMHMVLHLSDD